MKAHSEHPEFNNIDPLKESYRETIANVPERLASIRQHHAALLCIDMQYLDAAPGYGVFADAANSGVPAEAQEYYFDSLDTYVLPNVRRLQDCFRASGMEVIHTRIQSMTQTAAIAARATNDWACTPPLVRKRPSFSNKSRRSATN